MWKKQHGESWEEHGSSGLCHELLPSTAPHDMAGWQRASQSFHVSQTRGLESRSELFDCSLGGEGWKNRACFPPHTARPFTTLTLLLSNIRSG